MFSRGSSVVEQGPEKPCVGGSIPPLGTIKNFKYSNMSKLEVFTLIFNCLSDIKKNTPKIICIDGIDGSGKSFFAKEFCNFIRRQNKKAILCSVDNFHNPKEERYKKGKDSPDGFYLDSYNYSRFKNNLLEPFKKGQGNYLEGIYDVSSESQIPFTLKPVPENAILVVEGIFLQRPELISYWDLKIYLDVDFEVSLARNIKRAKDLAKIGTIEDIKRRYKARYMPGQKLYFQDAKPSITADIVINNNDFKTPYILQKKY